MATGASPIMADIIADYRQNKLTEELRGNWVVVLVNRVPSFGLVWLLARLPIAPNAVSWTAAAIALSLPCIAGFAHQREAAVLVFAAAYAFQVLDCADGGLARITSRATRQGAVLDEVVDVAQWGLLYLAIGVLADRQFGSGAVWSAIALGAGWIRLFVKLLRDMVPRPATGGVNRPVTPLGFAVFFLAGLSGAIPFLALTGDWLDEAVWLLLVYSTFDLGESLFAVRRRNLK